LENRNWKMENWAEKRKRFRTEGTEEEHREHGEEHRPFATQGEQECLCHRA